MKQGHRIARRYFFRKTAHRFLYCFERHIGICSVSDDERHTMLSRKMQDTAECYIIENKHFFAYKVHKSVKRLFFL